MQKGMLSTDKKMGTQKGAYECGNVEMWKWLQKRAGCEHVLANSAASSLHLCIFSRFAFARKCLNVCAYWIEMELRRRQLAAE